MKKTMSDTVHFKPYRGNHYKSPGYNGFRLLLLGESHYGYYKVRDVENATQHTIKAHLKGKPFSYFTKIFGLFETSLLDEQKDFWEHVAFYNYVQSSMNAPRQKPTELQWNNSIQPFYTVLKRLKPDIIIVIGKRLWFRTPNENFEYIKTVKVDTKESNIGTYNLFRKKIYATYIHHPASRGWEREMWKKHIKQFLNDSKQKLKL